MEIILATKVGFCFGVKRAFNLALKTSKAVRPCQVLGPLVHNESVIRKLQESGVEFINSLDEAKSGVIIIPTHGEDPEVLQRIKEMGLKMVDATCPLVKNVQDLTKDLHEKGNQIIIIGDKEHKEIRSIQAVIKRRGIIIDSEEEAFRLEIKNKSLAIIAQTTQNPVKVKEIIRVLKKRFKNLKFYNTICPSVSAYQEGLKELALRVDLLLIIGSKTSANTNRLVEIAKAVGKPVYHIENASQLKKKRFLNVKTLGIATGTSTPDWLIKEVIQKLKSYAP